MLSSFYDFYTLDIIPFLLLVFSLLLNVRQSNQWTKVQWLNWDRQKRQLSPNCCTFFLEVAERIAIIEIFIVISMLYNPFCVVLSVIVIFYESASFNFPNLSDLYFN